ncbi:MAG: 16S rRNA (cytosine(1402)-N(4))-methyltransferase RsmH [Thermodesulfobacteriota bacterium]
MHVPVLLEEVLSWLRPAAGRLYVDGNLGLGGHSEAILEASAPDGRLVAFEWDALALAAAKERLTRFADRITFCRRNFAEMAGALAELGIAEVDGILLDLGLSSLQIDRGGRGFSFRADEPLDMRMDQRGGVTAADLVNTLDEEELADMLYYYGEERQARRIAAHLVAARAKKPLATSGELAAVVERAVPRRFHPKKIHAATRTFQAIRIAVNRELDNLKQALVAGSGLLKPGGRFCIISFHSLEDRLVKHFFRDSQELEVVTAKPVTPGPGELAANPRSHSARLRVAQRRGAHGT